MFGISFTELFVITIVALLVIGPEKLPKVARTIGALTGRIQRYMGQVKEEVTRELRFEELQKLQQEIKQSVESAQSNIRQQVSAIESVVISQDEHVSKFEPVAAPKPVRKTRVIKSKIATPVSKNPTSDKNLTKKTVQKIVSKSKPSKPSKVEL